MIGKAPGPLWCAGAFLKKLKIDIDKFQRCGILTKLSENRIHGGIAQLGERLNGIQEVSGSIPLISTKKT